MFLLGPSFRAIILLLSRRERRHLFFLVLGWCPPPPYDHIFLEATEIPLFPENEPILPAIFTLLFRIASAFSRDQKAGVSLPFPRRATGKKVVFPFFRTPSGPSLRAPERRTFSSRPARAVFFARPRRGWTFLPEGPISDIVRIAPSQLSEWSPASFFPWHLLEARPPSPPMQPPSFSFSAFAKELFTSLSPSRKFDGLPPFARPCSGSDSSPSTRLSLFSFARAQHRPAIPFGGPLSSLVERANFFLLLFLSLV